MTNGASDGVRVCIVCVHACAHVCAHVCVRVHMSKCVYRIAGMFGGDKVWRIAKVVGEKKFGECL